MVAASTSTEASSRLYAIGTDGDGSVVGLPPDRGEANSTVYVSAGSDWSGSLTLVGETALGDSTGLTVNLGAAVGEDSDRTLIVIPTLSYPIASNVSGYAGYGGYFNEEGDEHWIETGLAFSAGADLQWDVNSAYDVENDQWFLGVGLSWRWR